MTPTVDILEAIASWLADQDLAQYNTNGGYENRPDKPAIVFGNTDTPDTLLILEVAADDRHAVKGLMAVSNGLLIRFTYRACGRDARPVERLADAVLQRFVSLASSGPVDPFGINVPPVLFSVGSVELRAGAVRLSERGLPNFEKELSKHNGRRFTRADTYRVGIY